MPERYAPIGGQAVIEGVMMRSPHKVATAVRLSDGTIQVESRDYTSVARRLPILGLPILRGAVVLVESLRIGAAALDYSADAAVKSEQGVPPADSAPWTSSTKSPACCKLSGSPVSRPSSLAASSGMACSSG